jgi:hypothetical protein
VHIAFTYEPAGGGTVRLYSGGALVRTGIFRGAANDAEHPAHILADDVGGAVDAILEELK